VVEVVAWGVPAEVVAGAVVVIHVWGCANQLLDITGGGEAVLVREGRVVSEAEQQSYMQIQSW
jgi:hypothetical protein